MFDDYYIVHKSILPQFFEAVVKARSLTETGMSASDAVKEVGISRSTFYKYKDSIIEASSINSGRKAVLSMVLSHRPGVLSQVLSLISKAGASVLTIDQSLPINSRASVTISLEINSMPINIQTLVKELAGQPGVENPRLIAAE